MKRNLIAIIAIIAVLVLVTASVVYAATTPPTWVSSATQARMKSWFRLDQRNAIYDILNDMDNGGSFWMQTGNAGTTPGTHYVGTSDDKDVVFKANTTEMLRLDTDGDVDVTLGVTNTLFSIWTGNLSVGNGAPDVTQDGEDAYIEGTLEVDGATTFDGIIDQDIDLENVGQLPTIDSAAITYTSSGAVWTVGASEIWFVDAIYCEVTTNFDCTGSDCTLTIGDGNDTDGFLVLVDAEMQAAATEFTGAPAGWVGLHTATMGAYLSGLAPFVYDGTDTIDIAIAGTDPAAGEATCYIVYTRIQ